ncbi:Autotransporter outer membrane beta-barrel domain-containing protein [Rickettsiales endosymbiont of Paramecium tredecaurelia]|uniref:autotransporter domain-containing protein n=1 Tax=Candidatus Sarmatiella mevalonica TaxID=2770581 RepID=UPI001920C2F5|nr:autotransporter outer membrane beta-barrel domain-containing protein [Candidatus Sarmatiella mevalonica]MBL3285013.1 Autotransporter outer membrane beta-barrel domain-containing protein [Candidatus Sarmatiella mevalonica]
MMKSFSSNQKKKQKMVNKIMNKKEDVVRAVATQGGGVIKRALITSALVAAGASQVHAATPNLGISIITTAAGDAVVNNGANVALDNAEYVWYGSGVAQAEGDLANLVNNVASPEKKLTTSAVTLVIDAAQDVIINTTANSTAPWTFSSMAIYLNNAANQTVTFNACKNAGGGVVGSFTNSMLTVGAIGTANVANFVTLALATGNAANATYGIDNLKKDMGTLPEAGSIGATNVGVLVLDGGVVDTGGNTNFYIANDGSKSATIARNTWDGLSTLSLDAGGVNRTAAAIIKIAQPTNPSWTMGNAIADNVNGNTAGASGIAVVGANVGATQSAMIISNNLRGKGTINAFTWGAGNVAANAVGLVLAHGKDDELTVNLTSQNSTGGAVAPSNPMGVGLYANGMGVIQTGAGSTTLNVSAISGEVCSTFEATGALTMVSASPVAVTSFVLQDATPAGGNIYLDGADNAEKVTFTLGANIPALAKAAVVLNRKVDVSTAAANFALSENNVDVNMLKKAVINISDTNAASTITIATLIDAALGAVAGPIAKGTAGGGQLNISLKNAGSTATITDLTLTSGGIVRGATTVTTANITKGALISKTATNVTFNAAVTTTDSIKNILDSCALASVTLDHTNAAPAVPGLAITIAQNKGGNLILSATADNGIKITRDGGGNGYLALTLLNPSTSASAISVVGAALTNFQKSAVLIRNESTKFAYTVKEVAADYVVFDGYGNTSSIVISDLYAPSAGTIVRTKSGVSIKSKSATLRNLQFDHKDGATDTSNVVGIIETSSEVNELYMNPSSSRGVLKVQSDVKVNSSGNNTLGNLVLSFSVPKKTISGQANDSILRDGPSGPSVIGGAYSSGSTLAEAEAPIVLVDAIMNHKDSVWIFASLEKNNLTMSNGVVKIIGALKSAKLTGGALTVGGATETLELEGGKATLNSVVTASIKKGGELNVKTAQNLELSDGATVYLDTKVEKVTLNTNSALHAIGGNSVRIVDLILKGGKTAGLIDTFGLTNGSLTLEGKVGSNSVALNTLILGSGGVYLNDESYINSVEVKSAKPAGLYVKGESLEQPKLYTITQITSMSGATSLPINIQNGVVQLNITQSTDKNAIIPHVLLGEDGVIKITASTNMNISAFGTTMPKNTAVTVVGSGETSEILLAGKMGSANLRIAALNIYDALLSLEQDAYFSEVFMSNATLKINNSLATPKISVTEKSEKAVVVLNNTQNIVLNMQIGSQNQPLSALEISGKDVTLDGELYTNLIQYTGVADAAGDTKSTKTILTLGKGISCNFDVISDSSNAFWIAFSGAQTINNTISIKNGGILCTTDDLLQIKSDNIDQISIISDKATGGAVVFEPGKALILKNIGTNSNALASVSINNRQINTTDSFAAKKLELKSTKLAVGGNAVILEGSIDAESAVYFGGLNTKAHITGANGSVYLHQLQAESASAIAKRGFELTLGTEKAPLALIELDAASKNVMKGAIFAQEIKNFNNIALDGALTVSGAFSSADASWDLGLQTMTLTGKYVGAINQKFNLSLDVDKATANAIVVKNAYTLDMSKSAMAVKVRVTKNFISALNKNEKLVDIKLFVTESGGVVKFPDFSQLTVDTDNDTLVCRLTPSGELLLRKKGNDIDPIPTTAKEITEVAKSIGAAQSTVSAIEEYNSALIESARKDPNGMAAAIQQRNESIAAFAGGKAVIKAQIQETNNPAATTPTSTAQTFTATITEAALGSSNTPDIRTADTGFNKEGGVSAGDGFTVHRTNAWIRPLYNLGNQNALATTQGYKMGQFGLITGINHTVNQTMFGMAIGYLDSNNKSKGVTAGARSDVKSFILSLYTKQDFTEQTSASVLFAYTNGSNKISNPRTAFVNNATREVLGSAKCRSNNFVLQVRGDYSKPLNDGYFVNPYLSLTAISLGATSYTEKADHLPDRKVKTAGSAVAQMVAGVNYGAKAEFNGGARTSSVYANLLLSTKNSSKTTVSIDGISPIVTPAAENQAIMFSVGAALDLKSADGLELGLGAGFVAANKYTGLMTQIALRLNF